MRLSLNAQRWRKVVQCSCRLLEGSQKLSLVIIKILRDLHSLSELLQLDESTQEFTLAIRVALPQKPSPPLVQKALEPQSLIHEDFVPASVFSILHIGR